VSAAKREMNGSGEIDLTTAESEIPKIDVNEPLKIVGIGTIAVTVDQRIAVTEPRKMDEIEAQKIAVREVPWRISVVELRRNANALLFKPPFRLPRPRTLWLRMRSGRPRSFDIRTNPGKRKGSGSGRGGLARDTHRTTAVKSALVTTSTEMLLVRLSVERSPLLRKQSLILTRSIADVLRWRLSVPAELPVIGSPKSQIGTGNVVDGGMTETDHVLGIVMDPTMSALAVGSAQFRCSTQISFRNPIPSILQPTSVVTLEAGRFKLSLHPRIPSLHQGESSANRRRSFRSTLSPSVRVLRHTRVS
jgi:hypothetical protein